MIILTSPNGIEQSCFPFSMWFYILHAVGPIWKMPNIFHDIGRWFHHFLKEWIVEFYLVNSQRIIIDKKLTGLDLEIPQTLYLD